jgi:hypothetical protein
MPQQTVDHYVTLGDAILLSAGESETIAAGVFVGSMGNLGGNGVYSPFGSDGSSLDNFGVVFSDTFGGVGFISNNGLIVNEPGAIITGYFDGIGVNGNNETIRNLGSIAAVGPAGDGIRFDNSSNHVQLANYGSITGPLNGVFIDSNVDGGTVNNYGSITSPNNGISVATHSGLTTHIANASGAVITGGSSAILSGFGAIDLVNSGTIDGKVFSGLFTLGASDSIINKGIINGSVYLLNPASASFNGKGGTSGDIFTGIGNDVILAGNGNISIHVGTGNTTMTAGPGHDRFVFDGHIGGHVDQIKGFNIHRDKIVLSEADLPGLGPLGHLHATHFAINGNAPNAGAQIVYIESSGFLYYDANGDHAGGRTHFATLAGHPPVGLGDFLVAA